MAKNWRSLPPDRLRGSDVPFTLFDHILYQECDTTANDYNCVFCFKGQHKVEFIPDIVGPILEMTLIPENGNNVS